MIFRKHRTRKNRSRKSSARRPLRLESLESRRLLAADLHGGVLNLAGTDANDVIEVRVARGDIVTKVNGEVAKFNPEEVDSISIDALAGNDRVRIMKKVTLDAEINGGDGNDRIVSGSGDDLIHGGEGNDTINGGAGDDHIFGDVGIDRLRGSAGVDAYDDDASDRVGRDREDEVEPLHDDSHGDDGGHEAQEVKLTSQLAGDASEQGKAEYEAEQEHGQLVQEFEVEIQQAAPDTTLDVAIDKVVVGQLTTDAVGSGRLKLATNPHGTAQPLPADFPVVSEGSTVTVGGTITGQLAVPTQNGGNNGGSDGGSDGGGDGGGDQHDSQESKLLARLAGAGAERGGAEFEQQREHGQLAQEFEIEVEHAVPGSTHDVIVDGVVVGQIAIGAKGRGRLKFSSESGRGHRTPFPADFPTLADGSTVAVGTILSGVFSARR